MGEDAFDGYAVDLRFGNVEVGEGDVFVDGDDVQGGFSGYGVEVVELIHLLV